MIPARSDRPTSANSAHPRPEPSVGFSLVEVTIALAVISFALVALLGLLGTSLSSAKESSEETAKVAILNFMTAELRVTGTNATNALAQPGPAFYFDSLGRHLETRPNQAAPSATVLSSTLYMATLTNVTNITNSETTNIFQAKAQLLLRSPYPSLSQTNIFPISVPR